jgi:LPS O-antigen subunit length determinant protein (WzzB/FepE family)
MPSEADHSSSRNDDKIDLGQFFATLWGHKFFIAFISIITLSLAAMYAFYIAKPMY